MKKSKKLQEEQKLVNEEPENDIFKRSTIKDLIAPSGIDVSNIDHLEIISNTALVIKGKIHRNAAAEGARAKFLQNHDDLSPMCAARQFPVVRPKPRDGRTSRSFRRPYGCRRLTFRFCIQLLSARKHITASV